MGTIDTIPTEAHPPKRSFLIRIAYRIRAATHHARAMLRLLQGRLDKRQSRIVLSELSDEQLRDIGKTRQEAEIEAAKSFWQ